MIKRQFGALARLLRLDFRRVFKDKSAIVVFSITVGLAFLNILIGSLAIYRDNGYVFYTYTARSLIQNSFQMSSLPIILIIILICMFIGKDLNYGTIRNKIIAGFSKRQIYGATFVMSLLIALAALVLYQLIIFAVGTPLLTFPRADMKDFWLHILDGYVLVIVAVAIVTFVELITRSQLAAIIISLIFFLFTPLLFSLMRAYFNYYYPNSIWIDIVECTFSYQAYAVGTGSFLGLGTITLAGDLTTKILISSAVFFTGLMTGGIAWFGRCDLK